MISANPLWCGYDPTMAPSLESAERALLFQNAIGAELKLSRSEAAKVGYFIDALPALAIVVISGGIFSIMWIYAMANCATGIAYIVIGLTELMLIAMILIGHVSSQDGDRVKTVEEK